MTDKNPDPADAPKSGFFKSAKKKARKILETPETAKEFLDDVENRLERKGGGSRLKGLAGDVKTLIRFVRAYVKKDYRDVTSETVILVVGALVYLINPFDLIPDFLPAGFVDDAAVIAFVLSMVQDELEDFRRWEGGNGGAPVPAPVE